MASFRSDSVLSTNDSALSTNDSALSKYVIIFEIILFQIKDAGSH